MSTYPYLEDDHALMLQAIAIGEKGRVTAPPNPWVGCVIINQGKKVGEGFHKKAGEPHAEAHALQQAGSYAKGSTVYITLEPCAHYGKTPPCVNALIAAGVSRVVIALQDPDSRVLGKGIQALREAGIRVDVGVAAKHAKDSLHSYLYQRTTGNPYTVLKAGISIDGKLAAKDGSSQWITTQEALENVHKLRSESQAILIGAETALRDLPALTVRYPVSSCQPLRILLDATGRVPATGPLFDLSLAPTLIFTTSQCPPSHYKSWKAAGCEVIVSQPNAKKHILLDNVIAELRSRRILQLLVEGGAQIHSSFLENERAQRLVVYVGPRIIGSQGKSLFATTPWVSLQEAPYLHFQSSQLFGETIRLDYELRACPNLQPDHRF